MSSLANLPMRDALIGAIYERMRRDPTIMFLSADMGAPALDSLRAELPGQFINVGIAEQNMISVAAGLAMEGLTVFTYAIASFYFRALEQIRINLALPAQIRPMNVNLMALGAGLSYDVSGPTHHCLEDISIMRSLPNLAVLSPADSDTALAIADFAPSLAKPKYIRLDGKVHRSVRQGVVGSTDFHKGYAVLRRGDRVALVATGMMTHVAIEVADRSPGRFGVIDVIRLDRGIDQSGLFEDMTRGYRAVISLEEAYIDCGGLDALVSSLRGRFDSGIPHRRFGLPQIFDFSPGDRAALLARHRLTASEVAAVAAPWLG